MSDTNFNRPFLLARAATPHLIAAGRGRISNVAAHCEADPWNLESRASKYGPHRGSSCEGACAQPSGGG